MADQATDSARETAALAGGSARAMPGDITSEKDVGAWVSAAEEMGGLAIAINAAAIAQKPIALLDTEPDLFLRMMHVNAFGLWLCMREEVRAMSGRGRGAIVNFASTAGLRGAPGLLPYSASKWAVIGMTRGAAAEYARHGIRINALCPGPILTPMLLAQEAQAPGIMEVWAQKTPIGRLGQPEEIAQAVLYLVSDAAAFVTGAILPVDGAMTA